MVRLGLAVTITALLAPGNGVLAAALGDGNYIRPVNGARCEYTEDSGRYTNDRSLSACLNQFVKEHQHEGAGWVPGEVCRKKLFETEGYLWTHPDHCVNACKACIAEAIGKKSSYAICSKKETLAVCGMSYKPFGPQKVPGDPDFPYPPDKDEDKDN